MKTSETTRDVGIVNNMEIEEKTLPERTKWSSNVEFLLSFIGYSVGLSNIWRFPYLCAKNGGAVFLIPYALFMVLFGYPLTVLELSLGQFSGKSAYDVWDICPIFRGVGVAMNGISVVYGLYYNAILCWILYYLVHSFMSPLPWTTCNNWWNTENCVLYGSFTNTSNLYNTTCNNTELLNTTMSIYNISSNNSIITQDTQTAAEEFWNYNMLRISSGIEEFGTLQWHLVVSIGVGWLLIFLCIIKGVKTVGKVVYVTAIGPFVLITIILIRAVTLPGAAKGIEYYLIPDFSKLADVQPWIQALMQIFFSTGIGWGAFITLASYNKFNSNIFRNTLIFCLVGEGTSFYAGFVVFAIIGFMSNQTGKDIEEVAKSGPGLAFIAYPDALSQLPLPQLWSVLFFIMLLFLALDSMFVSVEVCITAVVDIIPKSTQKIRIIVTALACFIMFIGTLSFATEAGIYTFQLVDWYMASVSVYIITLVECIVVGYIYGVGQFFADIEMMVGRRPSFILSILWRFITPLLLIVLFLSTLITYKAPTYGDYVYPSYASIIGWGVAVVSSVPIPIWMVRELYHQKGPILQRIRNSFKPNNKWGPSKDYYLTSTTQDNY